jgi:uncharacterized protein YjbI with pentapeptide repeats
MKRAVVWICLLLSLALAGSPCRSADLSSEQVREMLVGATRERPADLSGKSLDNLDLSNLDFGGANLSDANLFGAKLVRGLETVKGLSPSRAR